MQRESEKKHEAKQPKVGMESTSVSSAIARIMERDMYYIAAAGAKRSAGSKTSTLAEYDRYQARSWFKPPGYTTGQSCSGQAAISGARATMTGS